MPITAGHKTARRYNSQPQKTHFGEEDHLYAQAKFLADQLLRKFIEENPGLPFAITSISPTLLIGNSLSNRANSTSMGLQYL